MNVVIWALAGGILGWFAFSVLRFNEARGRLLSITIGAVGGIIGGKEIAPVFTTPIVGEFHASAMLFALAVAGAFLAISHLLFSRWGL